jgi:hypothetical protein
MTSGYDGGGDQSSTPFNPTSPLFSPGTKYQYWDSAMNQFANVLTRIAGEAIEALFKRRIADKIGMNASSWDWGDWGTVSGLLVNGGAGNKSKGISITAREMARFGHLFLNRGNWDGTQLISAAWVDAASSVQVANTIPANTSGADGPGVYGFNWWVNGVKPNGQRRWPNAPEKTYAALGYNNNNCYIIPEWNMVVVRLGTDGSITPSNWDGFFQRLESAVSPSDTTPPSVPAGLVATPLSESQIALSWQKAFDLESNISNYKIYIGGTLAGTASDTFYTAQNLSEGTQYSFQVSAVNNAGLEGQKSSPINASTQADNTPPAIAGVDARGDSTRVTVTFSEPVEKASAENIQNFDIDQNVTVSSAQLDADLKTVILTTSPMSENVTYTLTVNNVRDRAAAPNTITANSQQTFKFIAAARVFTDLLVLYTFKEAGGTTVNDVSGVGTPLNLTIQNQSAMAWSDSGLSITGSNLVSSSGPAAKIINACTNSNEISIEAWLRPANTSQSGPARIVSLSGDPSNRNFTLGQSAAEYDIRLRTTTTGNNGASPSLSTTGSKAVTSLTHVIYTRNASGTAKIYINGTETTSGTISGDLSTWDSGYRFGLANELSQDRNWLGDLFLVAVYSRALSQQEVTQNHDAGYESIGTTDFGKTLAGTGPVLRVYPNPFNQAVKIMVRRSAYGVRRVSLQIYDIRGKMIKDFTPYASRITPYAYTWTPSRLPAGLYLVRARTGNRVLERKLLLIQ